MFDHLNILRHTQRLQFSYFLYFDWSIVIDGQPHSGFTEGFKRKVAEQKAYTKVYNTKVMYLLNKNSNELFSDTNH